MHGVFDESGELHLRKPDYEKMTDREIQLRVAIMLEEHIKRGPHHDTPCQFSQNIEKKLWGMIITVLVAVATVLGALMGK